jgi:c-di-GMP-related signal transduction protein
MEAFVARQPIFTRKLKIYGYELLFREGTTNVFPGTEGNEATSKLISDSFFNIGVESITGGKRAFVNFTQELLVRKVPMMFSKEDITIEVLEDVQPTEAVIAACREMSSAGYQIALDDFLYRPDLDPLLTLSTLVKIDWAATSRDQREEIIRLLEAYPVKFLAEKIETYEDFQEAVEMNFHYFQGFFFSKPQIFKSKDISPQKLNLLRIIAEVNKEDFAFKNIEEMISRDVSMSYKLLRYINSPYFKRLCDISSINQAVVLSSPLQTWHRKNRVN